MSNEPKRTNWEKKYHFLQTVYQTHQELISFADAKAAAVITLNATILAFVGSNCKSFKGSFLHLGDPIFYGFLILVGLYLFVFFQSMNGAIMTLAPKVLPSEKQYSNQFLFALHVLQMESSRNYALEIASSHEDKVLEDYCIQIWQLSKILMNKFQNVQNSLSFLKYNFLFAFLITLLIGLLP